AYKNIFLTLYVCNLVIISKFLRLSLTHSLNLSSFNSKYAVATTASLTIHVSLNASSFFFSQSPSMASFISYNFFFIAVFFLSLQLHHCSPQYLKLPLLHKTPHPPAPAEALSADRQRLSALFSRHGGQRPKLPVTSAAASGAGQYVVTIHLGTPPQRAVLVADTGSDLTWVSCSACRADCAATRTGYFFPRRSETFSPYHCFDSACKLVPRPEKTAHCNRTRLHSVCRYEYAYSDGSTTNGFFSHETVSFNTSGGGRLSEFRRLSFGCGFWNSGPSISGPSFNGADGVLGLGRGPISIVSQLGKEFGHKFSYCLMDYSLAPSPTSYLLIGGASGNGVAGRGKLSYTPLLVNPLSPTFYYVKIENVLVEDVKLRISPSVWSIDDFGNGGTVLDSGTTLTFLAAPAYRKILAAFERRVMLPRSAAGPGSGSDLCLNVSGISRARLPRLSFKLSGGSVFSPPPRNYFIDAADGVKCLALQPAAAETGFSVLGNLIQQGYTFEFDRDRSRLGFTRHGCAVP
ncbi:aspartic proteinase NANA, chloroplast, partial [Andrographis paniculata]|uniref:aspartic proteinase NANA, chloroplast n=1 Tax=Andrographis paniculata TaxID=175694 RepID=UPI0021E7A291